MSADKPTRKPRRRRDARAKAAQVARSVPAPPGAPAAVEGGQRGTVLVLPGGGELDARLVLSAIRDQVDGDIRDLFDERGNLRPIRSLTKAQAAMIAGVEVVQRNLTAGDGVTDTVIKVKLTDRARYVEMAAKHLGLLVERVRVESVNVVVSRLEAARARLAQSSEGDA